MKKQQYQRALNVLLFSTELLSKEATQMILKVTDTELERLISEGHLEAVKAKNLILFTKASVLAFVRKTKSNPIQ